MMVRLFNYDKLTNEDIFMLLQGVFEGTFALMLSHPFDTVKVRLQTVGQIDYGGGEFLYTGPLDCFHKIIKREGIFSLYRGFSLPLFCIVPANLMTFFAYEFISKKVFHQAHIDDLTTNQLFLISILCGGIPAIFISPVERIKLMLQTPDVFFDHPNTTYYTLKHILKNEGVHGLCRGTGLTIARDSLFSGICVVSYIQLRGMLTAPSTVVFDKTKFKDYSLIALCGGVAGMLGWMFSIPIDYVKTRYQAAPPNFYENGLRDVFNELILNSKLTKKSILRLVYTGGRMLFLRAFFQYAVIFSAYEYYAEISQEKTILEIIEEKKVLQEKEEKENKKEEESDNKVPSEIIDPSETTTECDDELSKKEDEEPNDSTSQKGEDKHEVKVPKKKEKHDQHVGIKKWRGRKF